MESAIKTTGLQKRFWKNEVLTHLDLNVPRGSVFGFLGRNGAGKTTTIQILMDLIKPSGGRAEVLGLDPQRDSVALKHRIGYVSENPSLYSWMRVHEIVDYVTSLHALSDTSEAERLVDRFGLDRNARIGALSRGQAAQVGLVCALGHKPDLLILDEPVSGLDVMVRQDFLESIVNVIQEEERTVFLSSHLVHELERVADRIGIIEGGRLIVSDDIDTVKNSVKEVILQPPEGAALDLPAADFQLADEGQGTRLTVYDFNDRKLEIIKQTGARIIDVQDLPLERAFVAHLRRHAGGTE